jgi:predicted acyl esterase
MRHTVRLERTPKARSVSEKRAEYWPGVGYVCVIQNVRARYASGDESSSAFYSTDHSDAGDGYDLPSGDGVNLK